MFDTLSYIGKKLNEESIVWGIGASILLNNYGLIDKPNDIDILVDIKNIEKLDLILREIGEKKTREKTDTYSTTYFYEYVVDGFDVDVMAGLKINHADGIYKYDFDKNSITDIKKINEVNIPLTSLEDWYVIYQLIPNREKKVNMIEKYLLTNGVENPAFLEKALRKELPKLVRDKIEGILKLYANIPERGKNEW